MAGKKVQKEAATITNTTIGEDSSAGKKTLPAKVRARVPVLGRLSSFSVLVGSTEIYVGPRAKAYRKAEEYNISLGLDIPVEEIIS